MPLNPPPHDTHSRDHWWWRPGWEPGVRCYTFHTVFGAQPGRAALIEAVRALEPVRTRPGWDAIPEQWLHLTMQGVGFTDQVDPGELERVVETARAEVAGTGALNLELGPPVVDAEGVNLPAAHPALDEVRTGLRRALARVRGAEAVEEPPEWRPHVSVAYANTTGFDLGPVRALLEAAPVRARVRVEHVSLLRLHRDDRVYEWEEVARLSLL